MKKILPITVDRLLGDNSYYIEETLASECIDIQGDDVLFQNPIQVAVTAYISGDFLVLDCDLATECKVRCSYCNEYYPFQLKVKHYLEEIALDTIKSHIFDAKDVLREALLLEIPLYPLCGGSVCNNRALIEPYLSKKDEVV